jgi:hypothetical protein
MAGYHFEIRNTTGTEELGGMDFADDVSAVAFGKGIVQDLIRRGAKQYTGWTIEITEGERAVDSVPFKAKADGTRKR